MIVFHDSRHYLVIYVWSGSISHVSMPETAPLPREHTLALVSSVCSLVNWSNICRGRTATPESKDL